MKKYQVTIAFVLNDEFMELVGTAILQKSYGLKITGERLALINNEKGSNTSFIIEDLVSEEGEALGTRVLFSIHCEKQIEEFV